MIEVENPYCRCLYYASNALGRVMTKLAEESFSSTGLPPSYAFIVMSVNRNPGILSGELAEMMMLTPSTITRLIEKLEEQELVKRIPEGRKTMVFPTKKSVEMNDLIVKSWHDLYKRIVDTLGHESSSELTAAIYSATLKLAGK